MLAAVSALSLPPHAATAADNAARLANEPVLTGAAGTDPCGASIFRTSTFCLIVSTRSPCTSGEAILLGRDVQREDGGTRAAMKRDQLRSNKS